jgi:hypothetical protein
VVAGTLPTVQEATSPDAALDVELPPAKAFTTMVISALTVGVVVTIPDPAGAMMVMYTPLARHPFTGLSFMVAWQVLLEMNS